MKTAVDWIPIYAEARMAFPADVWLHTEDDPRGGVRITAYRREFDPPLPDAGILVPETPTRGVLFSEGVLSGEGADGELRTHVERIYSLSYRVTPSHPVWVHECAARRWENAAAERAARPLVAA